MGALVGEFIADVHSVNIRGSVLCIVLYPFCNDATHCTWNTHSAVIKDSHVMSIYTYGVATISRPLSVISILQ